MVCPALAKEKKQALERYEANAMSLEAGRASIMEITIFAWSSDADRQAMIDAFDQGGDKALYKHLSKQDELGFVSLPRTMGYQMRYAYQSESDGKRLITMATDRPIGMAEVMRGSMSQEDNISLVFLELDPATGEGTGEMIVGAGFRVDKKTGKFEIETLGQEPIKFTKVKPMKVKHKHQDK
jgi:hypothetical protein